MMDGQSLNFWMSSDDFQLCKSDCFIFGWPKRNMWSKFETLVSSCRTERWNSQMAVDQHKTRIKFPSLRCYKHWFPKPQGGKKNHTFCQRIFGPGWQGGKVRADPGSWLLLLPLPSPPPATVRGPGSQAKPRAWHELLYAEQWLQPSSPVNFKHEALFSTSLRDTHKHLTPLVKTTILRVILKCLNEAAFFTCAIYRWSLTYWMLLLTHWT